MVSEACIVEPLNIPRVAIDYLLYQKRIIASVFHVEPCDAHVTQN